MSERGQNDVVDAMQRHHCSTAGLSPQAQRERGWAIDVCVEDEQGHFRVQNDEYSSLVAFCPFCGQRAPTPPPESGTESQAARSGARARACDELRLAEVIELVDGAVIVSRDRSPEGVWSVCPYDSEPCGNGERLSGALEALRRQLLDERRR